MLINLRNALMAGKRLPYDAEVEYLGNGLTTHRQDSTIFFSYIDVGVAAGSNVGVRITYAYTTELARQGTMVCGSFVASGSGYFGVYNFDTNNYKMWGGATKMNATINVGDVVTTSTNFMSSGIYEDIFNGEQINYSTLSGAPTFNTGNIWLFSVNKGSYRNYEISGLRVYSMQVSIGQTLVRDFIPVRKGTVGYLYDRVSGKLFGNAGTGDFVVGQDVVPVEYLESMGTQWIATGLGAGWTSSSIKIAATLKFTDLSTGEHDLAGSGNAATPTMGRNGSNYFMWAKGGTTWYPTGCDTNWHKVSYTFNNPSGRVFELDGALYSGKQDNTFATGDGIHIFASGPNRYPLNCQLAKLEIWQNGVLVRKFLSVRVGTEGAMMDTLTRRIYRNAGTGAFGYGNDLKYPIAS